MPPNSRPRASESDIASLLQRFDALLEALRPTLAADRSGAPGAPDRPARVESSEPGAPEDDARERE